MSSFSCTAKGSLISETLYVLTQKISTKRKDMLRIVIWHILLGDLKKNEKLSEIKPPLDITAV